MSDIIIKIIAKDVSEGKFFFQEIGTGKYKGEDIKLMIEPPSSHDAIIMFRGKKYKVDVVEIANAICDAITADDYE